MGFARSCQSALSLLVDVTVRSAIWGKLGMPRSTLSRSEGRLSIWASLSSAPAIWSPSTSPGQPSRAGSGRQGAVAVVAELGQYQLEVAVGFVLADLGQQLCLSAARSGCVAVRCGGGNVFEVQFCGENTAGAVGQLQGESSSEHSQ
jgi:hypothetical protein